MSSRKAFKPPRRSPRLALRLALLSALGTVSCPVVPRHPLPSSPRKILVIRPDHLGDGLFTTPALRALRALFPRAEITGLVGPWSTPVYDRLDSLDRLITLEFPGFTSKKKRSLAAPYTLMASEARRLRRERFDLSVNLRFDFWWGAMLAHFARIPSRLGYAIPECRPYLTRAAPYVGGRHEVIQNLALVSELTRLGPVARADWLALQSKAARLEFPLRPPERAAAGNILESAGLEASPLVAIHPGTRGRAKLWTVDGWAAVGDALSARLGASVLLTGSGNESDLCRAIQQRMESPAVVIAGGTSLGELGALFERCSVVLGVDSGPLHLATAINVPSVHLYGPSDLASFAPFGNAARHIALRSDSDCSPCHRFDWPEDEKVGHNCMRAIAPAQVIEAAIAAAALGRTVASP